MYICYTISFVLQNKYSKAPLQLEEILSKMRQLEKEKLTKEKVCIQKLNSKFIAQIRILKDNLFTKYLPVATSKNAYAVHV